MGCVISSVDERVEAPRRCVVRLEGDGISDGEDTGKSKQKARFLPRSNQQSEGASLSQSSGIEEIPKKKRRKANKRWPPLNGKLPTKNTCLCNRAVKPCVGLLPSAEKKGSVFALRTKPQSTSGRVGLFSTATCRVCSLRGDVLSPAAVDGCYRGNQLPSWANRFAGAAYPAFASTAMRRCIDPISASLSQTARAREPGTARRSATLVVARGCKAVVIHSSKPRHFDRHRRARRGVRVVVPVHACMRSFTRIHRKSKGSVSSGSTAGLARRTVPPSQTCRCQRSSQLSRQVQQPSLRAIGSVEKKSPHLGWAVLLLRWAL